MFSKEGSTCSRVTCTINIRIFHIQKGFERHTAHMGESKKEQKDGIMTFHAPLDIRESTLLTSTASTPRRCDAWQQQQDLGRHLSQGHKRVIYLGPFTGLEAAVGVDPKLLPVAVEETHLQEALDLALNELHPAPPQHQIRHQPLQNDNRHTLLAWSSEIRGAPHLL